MSYNHLDIVWGYPNADVLPVKPIMFEEMKRISTVLSKGIPHVRVDLYECNQHIYFGEMTFFDDAGFGKMNPCEWERKLGEMIHLEKIDS